MEKDMTSGSPLKLIFWFSIPVLLGNIFQQLYNMVDSIIVGNFVGANALGAIGTTNSLNFFFFSLVAGLSVGIGIIVAQYFGFGDEEKVTRIYNKYGYSIVKVEKERGTMDGKPENKKYFLMNYKIYRNRFTTDCFSDYFNDLAGKTNVGLMDYIEYATEKASVDELKAQNSYFINGLYRDEEGA